MNILKHSEGFVYMLHFDRPIAPGRHTCQHYIGYADDIAARLQAHDTGHGARLTQVARQLGIGWRVVRLWRGDRTFERTLKERKYGPHLCPFCGESWRVRGAVELPIDQYELPF